MLLFFVVFYTLVIAHALADYPLQNDFLAKAKNRLNPVPGMDWRVILTMHALIHAGFVFLITSSIILSLVELVVHWIVDDLKCQKKITFNQDQLLHIGCKLIYALVVVAFPDFFYPLALELIR